MAVDNSAPRIRMILLTAGVAVATLISLKFIFDSYYLAMFEEEEYQKVGSVAPTALLGLRAAEQKSLATAPIPLDRAIQLVAKGRSSPIPEMPNDGITPLPSNDESSLVGWAQAPRPRPAPAEAPSAAPALPASSGSATTPVPPAPAPPPPVPPPTPKPPAPSAAPSPPPSPSAVPHT